MNTTSPNTQATDRYWNTAYKVGGISSIIAVLFGMIQVVINIISVGIMHVPVPATVIE
jgi:hypothetical protein